MLTIHHLAQSQSERIVWLFEELGIPYDFKRYERDPATRLAPPGLKALQPFGTVPVITDGAFALGETGAIVEYAVNKIAGGKFALQPDHPDYADYLYWLHFANGSFLPCLMVDYALQLAGASDADNTRSLRARGELAVQISERRLASAKYFAGAEFTIADIMMTMPLQSRRDLASWPNIAAYLQRIAERPAYRRAMSKAEPARPR
jgi:glutathione S-transferase